MLCEALEIDQKELVHKPHCSEDRVIHGEWIELGDHSKNEDNIDPPIILYLHGNVGLVLILGGAHIFMSPNSHRLITGGIVKNSSAIVFCPDYALAPEFPFPSAIADGIACYLALTSPDSMKGISSNFKNRDGKIHPNNRVFIMGDSSGGCLALQLVLAIKGTNGCLTIALNLPMPAGAILVSPFLDSELKHQSWHGTL